MIHDNGFGPTNQGGVAGVIDTKTFSLVGVIPSFVFGAALPFSGQWITTYDIDESDMLFGAAFDGVGFLDMSSPTYLKEPLPSFFSISPSLASPSSPTAAQLNGVGFTQDTFHLFIGAPPAFPGSLKATNLSVQSMNVLNATLPARTTRGPANVTLTRSDGFFEVMPDAVSYSPTILRVDADAASPSGGDPIKIVGYGITEANTQVSIGGKLATILQTTNPLLGQLFPTQTLTVQVPPGTPGLMDVKVTTPAGTATAQRAFQYVNSVQVYPTAGALDAIVYDQSRKRLYVSNQDHNRMEIFDLTSRTYLPPVAIGNAPTSMAMTPDAKLLAVLNSADATASVIDLNTMQVVGSRTLLTAADLVVNTCGGAPVQISAAVPHRILVSVNCTSLLEGGVAHIVDLDTGVLSCIGVVGCTNGTDLNLGSRAPVLASTADGTKIAFTAGDAGLLDLIANTIVQTAAGRFSDAAISADGSIFAAAFGTYDAHATRVSIMAYEAFADSGAQSFHNVFGEKLNPSGSLLFYPQDLGVDIFDVHTGRLVLHVVLPDLLPKDMNGMALDETGTKMFLISSTGLTVVDLYQVPLSLATITPSAAAPGATVVLRGSGFQNGATIEFGTAQVPATFLDLNTLQVTVPSILPGPSRVTVINPDGRQYSFDNAFMAK